MLGNAREKEKTIYMLSILHIKTDDDDVISLISTSKLSNLESSSHCAIPPPPSFLNFPHETS